ncbi:MAG: excinuclease ABC subunit UvrC [Gemmatimonadetes bacterium]|nr:excinuclease ABC subunit UvrC [Gemmatimonadota bacterium]
MRIEELGRLPARPGVYLLKDANGEILYVGKAKSLRARVRSYFRSDADGSIKTREFVRRSAAVDTIVVGSEAEALILEANLIKIHRPRFNIQLRDDKRYPYIKVTIAEPFPRVYVTRRVVNDRSRYLGPYTQVGAMRHALQVIKRLYTVRSCRYDLPREAPERPCLDYHIGRCRAPCVGLQDQRSYREMIDEILRVLEGDVEAVRGRVAAQMGKAATALDFERAAHLRDVLSGLDALAAQQRVQRVGGGDLDVVGLARDGGFACGVVLRVRRGVLLGLESHRFRKIEDERDADLLAALAGRFYLGRGEQGTTGLAGEILFPADVDDRRLFEEVLSSAAGRRVQMRVPQRGEKLRLIELANENARLRLEEQVAGSSRALERADPDAALYDLQERLGLKVVPRLMVCFDVSHTQGSETVASAAVFENGEPYKAEYRRMRIRGDWGNDDCRSIAEAVTRYFRRRIEEGRSVPELAVIDGGKGQLSAALGALRGQGFGDVHVVALAKREEEIYVPGSPMPLRLSGRSRALHLLQRVRNEAHRFAVLYNRKLRRRRTLWSELSEIPGIGPRRQQALLQRFGSVRSIREARPEEIARLPGFSAVLAHRVLEYLGR